MKRKILAIALLAVWFPALILIVLSFSTTVDQAYKEILSQGFDGADAVFCTGIQLSLSADFWLKSFALLANLPVFHTAYRLWRLHNENCCGMNGAPGRLKLNKLTIDFN